MILGRIAQQIKQQNWTSVFIELAIVVFGVFIGLQVDNWNQARQERGLEREYLQRLHDDMQLSIDDARDSIAWMTMQDHGETWMLERLAACRLQGRDRNRFAFGVLELGKLSPPPMVKGTIQELRSTGRLGLLRDLNLRKSLAGTLSKSQSAAGVLNMIITRATPDIVYVTDHVLIRQSNDALDIAVARRDGLPSGTFAFDFPALCKDTRFAAAIANGQQYTRHVIAQNRHLEARFQTLLAVIDENLGKPGPRTKQTPRHPKPDKGS